MAEEGSLAGKPGMQVGMDDDEDDDDYEDGFDDGYDELSFVTMGNAFPVR